MTATVPNPYANDPDVQLMLLVKDGDDAAFSRLVETYQDRLVGILSSLVSDSETAEDLAQEVFLRVYRARSGYEPTAKFSTWLFRIANNLASNSRRNRGRRKETQFASAESGSHASRPTADMVKEKSEFMPTRSLDKAELHQVINDSLTKLNDRQRMAVLLNKFEGMSYVDIADTMELSVPAVKSLLSRARETLREYLQTYLQS